MEADLFCSGKVCGWPLLKRHRDPKSCSLILFRGSVAQLSGQPFESGKICPWP